MILRHKPEVIGVELDKNGWCDVGKLIQAMNQYGKAITFDELEKIVRSDEKGRYAFNDNHTKIRANQGHSVYVELNLEEIEPPEYLYHGTVDRFLDSILDEGLERRQRQYVHLSVDRETASSVGNRRGEAIVLVVESKKMYRDGFSFYRSANGVWLCEYVPREYISEKRRGKRSNEDD